MFYYVQIHLPIANAVSSDICKVQLVQAQACAGRTCVMSVQQTAPVGCYHLTSSKPAKLGLQLFEHEKQEAGACSESCTASASNSCLRTGGVDVDRAAPCHSATPCPVGPLYGVLQGYQLYLVIFYILVATLFISVAICIWVGWCFKNDNFPYLWPIKVARVVVSLFVSMFYIASLNVFLMACACNKQPDGRWKHLVFKLGELCHSSLGSYIRSRHTGGAHCARQWSISCILAPTAVVSSRQCMLSTATATAAVPGMSYATTPAGSGLLLATEACMLLLLAAYCHGWLYHLLLLALCFLQTV